MKHVYGIFDFEFQLELSTRPEKYLGDIDTWNRAEEQLKTVLNEFGEWKLNPRDGAFYGSVAWGSDLVICHRAEDRYSHSWCFAPLPPVCNYTARFSIAYSFQPRGIYTSLSTCSLWPFFLIFSISLLPPRSHWLNRFSFFFVWLFVNAAPFLIWFCWPCFD